MTLFELLPSLRHGSNPHLDRPIWPVSAYFDESGRLRVGEGNGRETVVDLLTRDEVGPPTMAAVLRWGVNNAVWQRSS